MTLRSDIVVFSETGRPVLAAEVKTKLNASIDWAIRFRRNMLLHGHLPETEFFLIATPDQFFVWKNADRDLLSSIPTQVLDSRSMLTSYFEQTNVAPENISGSSFELIINSWLAELMYVEASEEQANYVPQEIVDLGLREAIRGGHVGQEVFA